jgi:Rha family phage regulatory protein
MITIGFSCAKQERHDSINTLNKIIMETRSLELWYTDRIDLVEAKNGQAVTSSLVVADYFKKAHKDVLKAIKLLDCSSIFQERNFAPSFYISDLANGGHKNNPMYYMTRDGFTFLAMGFTGKVAAQFKEAYINAFNEMEEKLRSERCTKYAERIVKKQIKEFNQSLQQTLASGRNKHGSIYGGMIPYGKEEVAYNPKESMESNLKRIFGQVHEMCKDGFLMTSLAVETNKMLQELINKK